jgi:hypothetical protein
MEQGWKRIRAVSNFHRCILVIFCNPGSIRERWASATRFDRNLAYGGMLDHGASVGTEAHASIETDEVMIESNKPFQDLHGGFLDQLRQIAQPPSNDPPRDPFAWTLAPLKPRPRHPAGTIAFDEPDED